MPQQYTVQQGDYISKIATKVGISDYTIIWNFPQNARINRFARTRMSCSPETRS